MPIKAISILLLALLPLSGCVALHANIPEDVVRRHVAREEGVELGAICSHEGQSFSEGAIVCMAKQRMTCDPGGRWMGEGSC